MAGQIEAVTLQLPGDLIAEVAEATAPSDSHVGERVIYSDYSRNRLVGELDIYTLTHGLRTRTMLDLRGINSHNADGLRLRGFVGEEVLRPIYWLDFVRDIGILTAKWSEVR